MWRLGLLIVSLMIVPMASACDFQYDPASIPSYYRAEGWKLLGTTDFNPASTQSPHGVPSLTAITGAMAQLLLHDEDPYIIEFPAQEFVLNGARKKMRPLQVKATLIRWKIGEQVIAYSYGLIPVTAHRVSGKWKIESEWACIFTATFIDDTGDGVFRVLVPGGLREDLVPRWAKSPKS